ncbi:MAG: rhomboid family intramembrane serine protease [Oscillospiraceae bacterium]|nr:rhomboid family intramembrane serine protease [Oscillospiraceae bacterium]
MKRRNLVIQYNAPVTLTFALLSFGVLVLHWVTNGVSTSRVFSVYRSSLGDILTYPRFFLHVLGHGSLAHYSGNITLMLVLGPGLEERYGSQNILWAMTVTAFVSGLLHWLFFPGTALLGASGIVFMMILMASLGGSRGGGIPLTLILVFVVYIGGELYDGLTLRDNISQLTHVVGGICGAVLGILLRRGRK